MTARARKFWKALFGVSVVSSISSLVAWGVLLTSFCSNPRNATPETQHVIAYSCHGMTVFISPLQQAMRAWLIPLGMLFMLLSVIAGVIVFLAHTKLSIDVRIEHTGVPGAKVPHDGD